MIMDDGETQLETPEVGAEFEVFLKSAGSYAAAKDAERDHLICDENGFAQTKDLPYGIYSVHQVYLFTLLTTVIISISMNATSSSPMNFKILMIS